MESTLSLLMTQFSNIQNYNKNFKIALFFLRGQLHKTEQVVRLLQTKILVQSINNVRKKSSFSVPNSLGAQTSKFMLLFSQVKHRHSSAIFNYLRRILYSTSPPSPSVWISWMNHASHNFDSHVKGKAAIRSDWSD